MSEAFKKIEVGLKEALAGDISSITIDGVRWLREGFYVHPATLAARDAEIEKLRESLQKARNTLAGIGYPGLARNICDPALEGK